MIFVKLKCGLGNQLFQYAAARRLALRHSTALKLDLSHFPEGCHRLYGLDRFAIAAEPASAEELEVLSLRANFPADQLGGMGNYHDYHKIHENLDEVLRLPDCMVLEGYFQSELYFVDIAHQICQELTLRYPPRAKAEAMFLRILSSPCSVGIHVRRGDYLSAPGFGLLPISYYQNALSHLKAQLGVTPEVFVFSDDPRWCQSDLDLGGPFQIFEGNELEPHDDLRLMSVCRHNIIANSSFSWWAAWLNRNPAKVVIAPRTFGGADYFPSSWRRM